MMAISMPTNTAATRLPEVHQRGVDAQQRGDRRLNPQAPTAASDPPMQEARRGRHGTSRRDGAPAPGGSRHERDQATRTRADQVITVQRTGVCPGRRRRSAAIVAAVKIANPELEAERSMA
jgi:hypothetical protein